MAKTGPGAPANAGGRPVVSADGKRWEDTHRRVTFHCSVALLEAIEAEMERSGRSKSQVITEALRAALGVDV